jgi:predicted DNA-binding transcriptional regulator AlpA
MKLLCDERLEGLMDLLTLEEVAELLRKSPAQIRWMRHAGTGPKSAKVGGRVMFRRADVIAWVDAQFAEVGD